MRRVIAPLVIALLLGTAARAAFTSWARRALPRLDGERAATGVTARVEIVRDRRGVPHIFAATDADAYFALGYCHAQDRLFQMELSRHVAQGRLAELFGEAALRSDRLFRTLGLRGVGQRMLQSSGPEVRGALEAYARGVNLAAREARASGEPIEFRIVGHRFEPAQADDFLSLLGYMAWGLEMSWTFDPLVERLVAKLGAERVAELLPWNFGGEPPVHPSPAGPPQAPSPLARAPAALAGAVELSLFELSPFEAHVLRSVPALRASNNWVLGPGKTTTGRALLANDPHLTHALPPIWYAAHLATPQLDVAGVTLPGLPLVAIGHNREIAWGMTNVMLDGGDFFLEKIDGDRVMDRGAWVKLETRVEEIAVKGRAPERLTVRSTPRGPLVGALLPGEARTLSYRWNLLAARDANELEGFYRLNRARDWPSFRAALAHFGAIAQNVVYADRAGHIGLQTSGHIPRYPKARPDGTRFRVGWDGSQDWDGFVPFEENPSSYDPPQGWLASANNPTVERSPYYLSDQWEPVDRILRIHRLIAAKPRLSIADVAAMQSDSVLEGAREYVALLLEAFAGAPPPDAATAEALALLRGWDFEMRADRAAPALFAVFERRLYEALFEDDFGEALCKDWRSKANVWRIMTRSVVAGGHEAWFDRAETGAREGRDAILRRAFGEAVRDLSRRFGDDPRGYRWGALHSLAFRHALSRGSRLFGLYFDRGPFPASGEAGTLNKMESAFDRFEVTIGPSLRQIVDLGDADGFQLALPGGQSGNPASSHYDDLLALWREGRYHTLPTSREAIDQVASARLALLP